MTLPQLGKLVFKGNFLTERTLASKQEENKKHACSFSLLSAKASGLAVALRCSSSLLYFILRYLIIK